MSTGAPRHHPLDRSRLPGQHQNSGWPSFNRAPGPVKGPPQLVWLPASVTSCNLRCRLGGRPCRCGREAGGPAGRRRREHLLHKAWKARPQQAPRGGPPRGHGDP